jgi:hypothetical protein
MLSGDFWLRSFEAWLATSFFFLISSPGGAPGAAALAAAPALSLAAALIASIVGLMRFRFVFF